MGKAFLCIGRTQVLTLGLQKFHKIDFRVFKQLEGHNLKPKPSKCHLLKDEMLFLGHIVSGEGLETKTLIKGVED